MLAKRSINGFSTNTTRFISTTEKKALNIVDAYESEVGLMAVYKSRDQLQAASQTAQGNSFIAIDPDMFAVGVLRPFSEATLGKDGDRERRMIVGEYTLIARSEKGGVAATGLVANIPNP